MGPKSAVNIDLLRRCIPGFRSIVSQSRLDGLTNENTRLQCNDSIDVLYQVKNSVMRGLILSPDFPGVAMQQVKYPRVYFHSRDLLVRDFVANMKPITAEDLSPKVVGRLVGLMKSIHELPLMLFENYEGFERAEDNTPISKLEKILRDDSFLLQNEKLLRDRKSQISSSDLTHYLKLLDHFIKNRTRYLKLIQAHRYSVHLCHNDINLSNILHFKDDVLLIDYEYADFNSTFYEVANFFVEMRLVFHDQPPYFKKLERGPEAKELERLVIQEYFRPNSQAKFSEYENLVTQFSALSHVFWTIVSIQTLWYDFKLDFPAYTQQRFEDLLEVEKSLDF